MAKTRVVLAVALMVFFVIHAVSAHSNAESAPSALQDTLSSTTSWVDWARNKFSGMLDLTNSENPTEEGAPTPAPSPELRV